MQLITTRNVFISLEWRQICETQKFQKFWSWFVESEIKRKLKRKFWITRSRKVIIRHSCELDHWAYHLLLFRMKEKFEKIENSNFSIIHISEGSGGKEERTWNLEYFKNQEESNQMQPTFTLLTSISVRWHQILKS